MPGPLVIFRVITANLVISSDVDSSVCTGRCPGQLCRIINNKADCYDLTPTSCFQKSCSNNQHCIMVGSTPTCQCNTGYCGFPSCNIPISCSTKICGANMHCRMSGVTPECACDSGFYQTEGTCIKFPPPPTCTTKSCSTNQHCIMSSGMPTCVCDAGWTGEHCNIHICNKKCINGSCQWFNGDQRCKCNDGYIGETCAEREPQPCIKARVSTELKIGSQKIAPNNSFDFLSHYLCLVVASDRVLSLH